LVSLVKNEKFSAVKNKYKKDLTNDKKRSITGKTSDAS